MPASTSCLRAALSLHQADKRLIQIQLMQSGMHIPLVFPKGAFSILIHMFVFLCLLLVTPLHITGVGVLIYFRFQIPVWQPVHRLQIAHLKQSFSTFLKIFPVSPACTGLFQLTTQRRCQVSHCHLLQHGATEGHCSFSACRASHSVIYMPTHCTVRETCNSW